MPREGINFEDGYLPLQVYLVPYLLHIGHPEVNGECTLDINTWVGTHMKKWFDHPTRKDYVIQGFDRKYRLNKQGWEELLRLAEVIVINGVVKLKKRKGVK